MTPPSTTARSPVARTGPPAGGRPGPVHLNFPLREPLAPVSEELDAADWEGRAGGRPWTELREHASAPHADDVHALGARWRTRRAG